MLVKNHPRDSNIYFEEEGHIYRVGKKTLTSVTSVVKSYFTPFDADLIIDKMQRSTRWPESKYYGMEKEEIKQLWESKGKEARDLGTLMHEQIEKFFLFGSLPEEQTTEFKQFLQFWQDYSSCHPENKPYRTEWRVYGEEVAGSIDFVLRTPEDKLILLDWKRSKEIKESNPWQRGNPPFTNLPDCNFSHYSLQLNCYREIIERFYGKKVESMHLAVFHPDYDSYRFLDIKHIPEVAKIIN